MSDEFEKKIAEAEAHTKRARQIIEEKAGAGNFDIGGTTVGALILALESLLAALKSE